VALLALVVGQFEGATSSFGKIAMRRLAARSPSVLREDQIDLKTAVSALAGADLLSADRLRKVDARLEPFLCYSA
jgi:hypothetical protein